MRSNRPGLFRSAFSITSSRLADFFIRARSCRDREKRTVSAPEKTPDAPSSFGPMWGYRWAKALGIKVDGRLEPAFPTWVGDYGKNPK